MYPVTTIFSLGERLDMNFIVLKSHYDVPITSYEMEFITNWLNKKCKRQYLTIENAYPDFQSMLNPILIDYNSKSKIPSKGFGGFIAMNLELSYPTIDVDPNNNGLVNTIQTLNRKSSIYFSSCSEMPYFKDYFEIIEDPSELNHHLLLRYDLRRNAFGHLMIMDTAEVSSLDPSDC